MKYTYACRECGSTDVLADAFAVWSDEKQEWEISDIMDRGHHCSECDGECRLERRELVQP